MLNVSLFCKTGFQNIKRSSRCISKLNTIKSNRLLFVENYLRKVISVRLVYDKAEYEFYTRNNAVVPAEHKGMLNNNKAIVKPINAIKGLKIDISGCVSQLRNITIFLVKDSKRFPSNWENVEVEERIQHLKSENVLATSYCHHFSKRNNDKETSEEEVNKSSTLPEESSLETIVDTYKNKLPRVTIVIEDRHIESTEWETLVTTMQQESQMVGYSRAFILNSLFEFIALANCAYREEIDVAMHLQSELMLSLVQFATQNNNHRLSHRGMAQYLHELLQCNLLDFAYHNVYLKFIKDKSPVLSPKLQMQVFSLLLKTKHWKEGIPLLSHMQVHGATLQFHPLIKAAIQFGTYEDVMELYNVIISNGIKLKDVSILELINYHSIKSCNKAERERNTEFVMKLLSYMKRKRIFPSNKEIAVGIAEWFLADKYYKWNMADESTKSIGSHLKNIKISDQECYELGGYIFRKILTKTDDVRITRDEQTGKSANAKVMTRATPLEAAEYKQFILENGPYDVVVDGLNMYYGLKLHWSGRVNKHKKPKFEEIVKMLKRMGQYLTDVQEFFSMEGKKIRQLVIFRYHMRSALMQSGLYDMENIDIFLASNTSHDDNFVTIAALLSGKDCKVVSNDLFRNSKQNAGQEYGQLFYDWQRINQCNYAMPDRYKRLYLLKPCPYAVSVQNISGRWYIPYHSDESEILPRNWILVSKSKFSKPEGTRVVSKGQSVVEKLIQDNNHWSN